MKKQLIFSALVLFATSNSNAMAFRRVAQAASSHGIVRNLARRASQAVQKWEYKILDLQFDIDCFLRKNKNSSLNSILVELGKDGWELVVSTQQQTWTRGDWLGEILVFKRPILDSKTKN